MDLGPIPGKSHSRKSSVNTSRLSITDSVVRLVAGNLLVTGMKITSSSARHSKFLSYQFVSFPLVQKVPGTLHLRLQVAFQFGDRPIKFLDFPHSQINRLFSAKGVTGSWQNRLIDDVLNRFLQPAFQLADFFQPL